MDDQEYYFLAQADDDAADASLASSLRVISIPWWPEAVKHHYREANEAVDAPVIFTNREMAEAELNRINGEEPERYLQLVEEHGSADVDEALDNTAPLRVFSLGREDLLDKLEDSDFLCVDLDGRLKLRRDFVEELRKQVEQE